MYVTDPPAGRLVGDTVLLIVNGFDGAGRFWSHGVLVQAPKLLVYFCFPPLLRSANGEMIVPGPVDSAMK